MKTNPKNLLTGYPQVLGLNQLAQGWPDSELVITHIISSFF
jgi:hypothetical protein